MPRSRRPTRSSPASMSCALPLPPARCRLVFRSSTKEMLCAQASQLEDDSSPESAPSSYGGYTAEELRDLLSGQEADVRAQFPNRVSTAAFRC